MAKRTVVLKCKGTQIPILQVFKFKVGQCHLHLLDCQHLILFIGNWIILLRMWKCLPYFRIFLVNRILIAKRLYKVNYI